MSPMEFDLRSWCQLLTRRVLSRPSGHQTESERESFHTEKMIGVMTGMAVEAAVDVAELPEATTSQVDQVTAEAGAAEVVCLKSSFAHRL